MSAVTFPINGLWMQYFTKNWAYDGFRRKYCTIKDGAQTYDFIADKSGLIVIHHYFKSFKWMRSNQNTGKMNKII